MRDRVSTPITIPAHTVVQSSVQTDDGPILFETERGLELMPLRLQSLQVVTIVVSILLLAILALFVADTLQHLNAIKILLVGCANLLAALAYAFLAPVEWRYAVVLMFSSLLGGRAGAHYARRIPGDPLRISIAAIGLVVAAALALRAFS